MSVPQTYQPNFVVVGSQSRRVPRTSVEALVEELLYAWDRTSREDARRWAETSVKLFGRSLVRRVSNVADLRRGLAALLARISGEASAAYKDDRLAAFVAELGSDTGDAARRLTGSALQATRRLTELVKNNPRESVPQLVTMITVSLLVSGGPDGDGGAPDLDLLFGLDAHRSLFSHSIVMGAALETLILSLVSLVQAVHTKLPASHSPLWDKLNEQAKFVGDAASAGVNLGMAYHLFVDGVIQPHAYSDLPGEHSLSTHQSIFVANALSEALDATTKKPLEHLPAPPTKKELAEHKSLRKTPYQIPLFVPAHRLEPSERKVLREYGRWLLGLQWGDLRPYTEQQVRFINVANGHLNPVTTHELVWVKYQQVWLDAIAGKRL